MRSGARFASLCLTAGGGAADCEGMVNAVVICGVCELAIVL
jgi:hypothetical protein